MVEPSRESEAILENRRLAPVPESERISSVPPPIPRVTGPSMASAMAAAVFFGMICAGGFWIIESLLN
jgi:hypothetical protein